MEQALTTRNYQGVFVHEHGGQYRNAAHRAPRQGRRGRRAHRVDGRLGPRVHPPRRRAAAPTCPTSSWCWSRAPPTRACCWPNCARLDTAASGQYRLSELAPHPRQRPRRARDRRRAAGRLPLRLSDLDRRSQRHAAEVAAAQRPRPGGRAARLHRADAADADRRRGAGSRRSTRAAIAGCATTVWPMPVRRCAPAGDWQARELPPGFRMTARSTQSLPGSSRPVTHLVFSDGLASVSVFVEEPCGVPLAPPAAATCRRAQRRIGVTVSAPPRRSPRGGRPSRHGDRRSAAGHGARHRPFVAGDARPSGRSACLARWRRVARCSGVAATRGAWAGVTDRQ